MKLTSRIELSKYKILPFNIYNEAGDVILKAGDVLTVGKLLQLKAFEKIFRDYSSEEQEQQGYNKDDEEFNRDEQNQEDKGSKIDFDDFDYENLSLIEYKTPINKYSKIDYKDQMKIKTYLKKTMELLNKTTVKKAYPKLANLGDIINKNVIPKFSEIEHYSELRMMGDYEICHPINVAIMAGMIAKKMDFENEFISDIILAGILHDIGKYRMPKKLGNMESPTSADVELMKKHTIIGYNILKKELNLPEHICNVALQHHENNDGTGYPHGTSSDWIALESQIINVCNFYDNLAFNRTGYSVKNNRDVLRLMLNIGTKNFSAEILYTFAHMFSYNDTMDFEEMVSYTN